METNKMGIRITWPEGEVYDDKEAEQMIKSLAKRAAKISFGQTTMDEGTLHKILNQAVKNLPLPARVKTPLTKDWGDLAFRRHMPSRSIWYLGELVQQRPSKIRRRPGMSHRSMMQINQALTKLGICFGMDVMGWEAPALPEEAEQKKTPSLEEVQEKVESFILHEHAHSNVNVRMKIQLFAHDSIALEAITLFAAMFLSGETYDPHDAVKIYRSKLKDRGLPVPDHSWRLRSVAEDFTEWNLKENRKKKRR